jgi:hypothetical protein
MRFFCVGVSHFSRHFTPLPAACACRRGRAAGAMADEARAAAAAATVAPILQLKGAALAAHKLARNARASELFERALRAAQEALPAETVIEAILCVELSWSRVVWERAHVASRAGTPAAQQAAAISAAWLDDAHSVAASQRALRICHARWRAGTLLTVTPEEHAFFGTGSDVSAHPGADAYVLCAQDAARFWPALRDAEEERERVYGIYGALQTVLQTVIRDGHTLQLNAHRALLDLLVQRICNVNGDTRLLSALTHGCGLAHEEFDALRAYLLRHDVRRELEETAELNNVEYAALTARGAADVARHGLRACALPECAATEPQPKAFKVCGRCRAVVYCSAAHQQQDWRRHKRSDGCKAPPPPPP